MTIAMRKKVLLPLLLLATIGIATAATAGQGPKIRDSREVWADIQSGKAPRVPTAPGREVRYAAVWNGCMFVFLKSHISSYQTPDGIAEVSERPDPLPPKAPDCVEREPTAGEMTAARAQATALNAGSRPAGAPAPPSLPPGNSRSGPR